MEQQKNLLASKEELNTLESMKAENEENLTLINLEKLQKQYEEAKAMQEAIILKKETLEGYKTYESVEVQEIDHALKVLHTLQVNQVRQEELRAERDEVKRALEHLYTQYDAVKALEGQEGEALGELEEIVSTYHLYETRKKQYETLDKELKTIKPDTLEQVESSQIIDHIKSYELLESEKKEIHSIIMLML